jgi:cytochrome c-type biogenesis protein CcmH/NrfF
LILSSTLLWLITAAILAVGLVVLLIRRQRQQRAVKDLSKEVLQ